MATPDRNHPRGLRLQDLIGLVVGYGMAGLLARTFWPRSRPLTGFPLIALGFEFFWLGLAMSGPVLLLLDRRGGPAPSKPAGRPRRPGMLISRISSDDPPVGRSAMVPTVDEPSRYTRAELAWMVIGGYWIALTLFVVPALSIDTPWALVGLLQVIAALGLWVVVPASPKTGDPPTAWTHRTAMALLLTWPIAWIFLILLGRSL